MAAISTAVAIAAIIAGAGTATSLGHSADDLNKLGKSYKNFNKALKDNGLEQFNMDDMIREMYQTGYINPSDYKKGLAALQKVNKASNDKTFGISGKDWTNIKTGWGFSNNDAKELASLYNKMAAYSPDFAARLNKAADVLPEDIVGVIRGAMPAIANAPKPDYFDLDFNPQQLDVPDLKIWTNPELAKLHDVNYNLSNYYNLIKQGTKANVALSEYENAQTAAAALRDEDQAIVSYLDSLRNVKSEAAAKGATAGARAAAELLSNVSSIQNNANTQAGVFSNNYANIKDNLLADANAQLTARDYFDQLANSLMGNSASYYNSDAVRNAQFNDTNATMYAADTEELAARMAANASMYANQVAANAQIANYRAQANAGLDQFAWVFNNAVRANTANYANVTDTKERNRLITNAAINDTNRYIWNSYSGSTNPIDYLNLVNNGDTN